MAEQQPPGYDEKGDEKREEKEEKFTGIGSQEKWQRDPLSTIIWAAILVMAGTVLLVDNLGILPFVQGRGWSFVFLGAGLLFLLEAAMRYLLPEFRRPIGGTLIFAAILIGIGLSGLGLGISIWALIIIAVGVSLLINAIRS